MNIIVRKIFLLVLGLASVDCYGLGLELTYDQVFSSHASTIKKIITCGDWSAGEKSGQFRVIELDLYGQSYLYIDRVAINADQTAMEVIDGMGIKEFNNDHADFSLIKITCRSAGNGIVIKAIAESGHDDSRKKISIEVNADNMYTMKGF
ncbi:MAG: hypothetical protein ABI644_05660 [Arenimonas sp.]